MNKNFRSDRRGGGSNFGSDQRRDRGFGGRGAGRPNFQRRDRDEGGFGKKMFDVICSDCGKKCQVPFNPVNGKEVFCSDCFANKGGFSRNESPRRNFGDKKDFGNSHFKVANNKENSDISRKMEELVGKIEKLTRAVEGLTKNNSDVFIKAGYDEESFSSIPVKNKKVSSDKQKKEKKIVKKVSKKKNLTIKK